jgi:AGCS family alanine or glycine:cation symporter
MAHASAQTDSPAAQGVWGLVEVFVDTVLLCTVTALAILVSDSGPNAYGEDAVRTAQAAFSSVLGEWAGGFFAVSVLLFGVATVICWSHYGMTCVKALTPSAVGSKAYTVCFCASVFLGSVLAPGGAWRLADLALVAMTALHLTVLLIMHREVEEETERLLGEPKERKVHKIE